jgi:hypothetical protein
VTAELEARRTSAAAVLADFDRVSGAYLDDPSGQAPRPDYGALAYRLRTELGSLLEQLTQEPERPAAAGPDTALGVIVSTWRLTVVAALGDAVAFQESRGRAGAEQRGLYLAVARELAPLLNITGLENEVQR